MPAIELVGILAVRTMRRSVRTSRSQFLKLSDKATKKAARAFQNLSKSHMGGSWESLAEGAEPAFAHATRRKGQTEDTQRKHTTSARSVSANSHDSTLHRWHPRHDSAFLHK
jgi:hypothetical protein